MVARAVSRTGSVGRFAPPPKRDLALTAPVQTADVLNKVSLATAALANKVLDIIAQGLPLGPAILISVS